MNVSATQFTNSLSPRGRRRAGRASGVHVRSVGIKASQLVGKGVGVAGKGIGKGVGVAGKGAAKTGKGALTATRMVAKNTVQLGKGTVGVVGNLPGNAIDVAKGVTNLPGNAIHLAGHTVKGVTNLVAARTLRQKEVVDAAAWKTRATARVTQIELQVACRNLRRKDAFSQCDAFAVLWQVPSGYGQEAAVGKLGADESFSTLGGVSISTLLTEGGSKKRKGPRVNRLPTHVEKELGRTEVVKGTRDPEFKHKFVMDFKFQEEQTYVIRVYDNDLEFCDDLREHDFLGGTIFTMGDLMGVGRRLLRRPLQSKGNDGNRSVLTIEGNEVKSTRSVMDFRFSAEDLKEKDKVIDKTDDLYFHLEKLNMEDQTWQPVYKSEVVMHNNRPTWAKARIPLPELCNNNICTPLKITFWDWARGGQSEQLGYMETTCQVLIHEAERGIPAFDVWREKKRTFVGRTKTKRQGKLKILRAELKPVPTILEYVCGGCKLDVTIAVDCSQHNEDPQNSGSLHDRPGPMWLNDYQAAINKIGSVLHPYTSNGEFNIWGYGATLRGEETTLFPIGYGDGIVKGASGMLDAYDTTFLENPHYMEPGEDTDIGPILQTAMYRAIQKTENEHCYSVLCILTAGKIGDDLRETIDTICTAAEDAPLSIVIIGVGEHQEDFEAIKLLVANGGKLRHSNGVPIARDIVGFASFSELKENAGMVVAEALKEVPEQLVEYFTDNGIQPRPPLAKEEEMSASMKDGSKGSMGGSSRRRNGHNRSDRSSRSKSPKRGTKSAERKGDVMSASMTDSSMGRSGRRRDDRNRGDRSSRSKSPKRGTRSSESSPRSPTRGTRTLDGSSKSPSRSARAADGSSRSPTSTRRARAVRDSNR